METLHTVMMMVLFWIGTLTWPMWKHYVTLAHGIGLSQLPEIRRRMQDATFLKTLLKIENEMLQYFCIWLPSAALCTLFVGVTWYGFAYQTEWVNGLAEITALMLAALATKVYTSDHVPQWLNDVNVDMANALNEAEMEKIKKELEKIHRTIQDYQEKMKDGHQMTDAEFDHLAACAIQVETLTLELESLVEQKEAIEEYKNS